MLSEVKKGSVPNMRQNLFRIVLLTLELQAW